MRIKLTIAYDGRPYQGWQSQPSGNTIQDCLQRAAEKITGKKIVIQGSGRTDAGVHAIGQVAHFDAPPQGTMGLDDWQDALNANLPASIRVTNIREVETDFHARFSALRKTYRYEIVSGKVLLPLLSGLVWHVPYEIDENLLRGALQAYRGRHDFQAFSAKRGNETEATDYHRTIERAELVKESESYRIYFEAEGFLYKMVRLLVGTAMRVAMGRLSLAELKQWLDQAQGLPDGRSSHCAPPDGLYLDRVDYP